VSDHRIAVFLDRDGTVIEEEGFLRRPENVRLIPGAARAIRRLNDGGILACIVSNQSGVARGYLTESDLVPIHERLTAMLQDEGAWIDRIAWCPHHPTEGRPPYNIECDCRKPRPGMIHRLAAELGIAPHRSFVIGDRVSDVQLGTEVGAQGMLVLTGYGQFALKEARESGVTVDRIFPSIVEAVDFVLQQIQGVPHQHA
jgi:D-glycero-D-manno-heptose 1,7-bisphosphate phosphatase